MSFSAKWKQAQRYAEHIPHPLENLKKHLTKASKILLLDGKYVSVLGLPVCVHIAYDTGIGVVDFWIDDAENKTAYSYILRRLKERGYEPVCAVSDDNSSISTLLAEENIPHQLCIFHLLRSLRKNLAGSAAVHSEIPPKYQVMYSRMKGIFKTKNIEQLAEKIDQFRKLQFVWTGYKQKRTLAWFWDKVSRAVIGLSFEEKVPRTNNLLENLNGQIEQRLKTFRGVKSEKSLNKILTILFYLRKYK